MASPIHEALETVFAGQDLSADVADAAMTQIMGGEATDAQIGAFLAALRQKGESVSEITGCARAMKRVAVQVRPALDEPSARAAARRLRDEGVEAVAVALLHAYATPASPAFAGTGRWRSRRPRWTR